MKHCNTCDSDKPLDDFARNSHAKDGRQSRCRACKRAHYLNNKADYRARHLAWRAEHPGRVAELAAEWRRNNPERAAAVVKAWHDAHPESMREVGRKRRAAITGSMVAPFTHTDLLAHWEALGLTDCVYCGSPYEHADHVIPLSRGGAHSRDNLVPACAACNLSKGAKLLEEWLPTRQ